MIDDATTARLVSAAAAGDEAAWDALVDAYTGMLWAIARSFRLDQADAGDAVQTTWLRLVENLDRIEDPRRLPGWLATTVRRECLRILRRGGREAPGGEDWSDVLVADTPPVDAALLADERDAALWRALQALGERCQQLLRVLMATPPPSYAAVSAALGIPVGSIGPSRGRCLDQLRRIAAGDDLLDLQERL
ncbi:RNA polymerase sigma factor [Pseudonocardia sp. CA-107938]|uniref:RNA polymerase sigma factor n=1 Tax=Pseudonocardia sp. CA-107938 TaxID=3240021 RepID=UPI003D9375EF